MAKGRLKRSDLGGDGWLGDKKLFRGAGEAFLAGYFEKRLEMIEVHRHRSLLAKMIRALLHWLKSKCRNAPVPEGEAFPLMLAISETYHV